MIGDPRKSRTGVRRGACSHGCAAEFETGLAAGVGQPLREHEHLFATERARLDERTALLEFLRLGRRPLGHEHRKSAATGLGLQ